MVWQKLEKIEIVLEITLMNIQFFFFYITGRDLEPGREGGTWLAIGCNENSHVLKIGALLNIRMPNPNKDALGRGEIVTNFVKGMDISSSYCNKVLERNYNTFNFVTVEIK